MCTDIMNLVDEKVYLLTDIDYYCRKIVGLNAFKATECIC